MENISDRWSRKIQCLSEYRCNRISISLSMESVILRYFSFFSITCIDKFRCQVYLINTIYKNQLIIYRLKMFAVLSYSALAYKIDGYWECMWPLNDLWLLIAKLLHTRWRDAMRFNCVATIVSVFRPVYCHESRRLYSHQSHCVYVMCPNEFMYSVWWIKITCFDFYRLTENGNIFVIFGMIHDIVPSTVVIGC